jgi:phosphohistidine phosphatase
MMQETDMDIIFWRHAQAQDGSDTLDDLDRPLTARGIKHAKRVGDWLEKKLPDSTKIWCSPALRCRETAQGLGRKFKTSEAIVPSATAAQLLELIGQQTGVSAVLIIGHQPALGQAAAMMLGLSAPEFPLKKGALCWLRLSQEADNTSVELMTLIGPEWV